MADLTNALVADVNGDGNLDIVAVTDGTAYIFPGHGDFTFGAPATLTTGVLPLDGVIADLNGDGRQDIVLANSEGHSISIFLNHGALTFTAADMPLDMSANDVVARDLDGDGKIDLVVAMAARMTSNPDTYSQGFAYVLFGHGDGTFAQPISTRPRPVPGRLSSAISRATAYSTSRRRIDRRSPATIAASRSRRGTPFRFCPATAAAPSAWRRASRSVTRAS